MAGPRGARLPDLYDPEQKLAHPTPLPVYYIENLGGFVAKGGLCFNTSGEAIHLEGRRVRDMVAEHLRAGRAIWRVYPGQTKWHRVLEPLHG